MRLLIVIILITFSFSSIFGQETKEHKGTDMKLSNIRLLVNNFGKSYTFYNEILGLNCTWGDKNSAFASFDIGLSSGLAIFKAELMAEAIGNSELENNSVSNEKFAIIIEVNDVDEMFTTLKNKSVEFTTEPKDMIVWGIRVAHFRDPDGNLIEIFSSLPKPE